MCFNSFSLQVYLNDHLGGHNADPHSTVQRFVQGNGDNFWYFVWCLLTKMNKWKAQWLFKRFIQHVSGATEHTLCLILPNTLQKKVVHQSVQSSYLQRFPQTLKNRDLEEKDVRTTKILNLNTFQACWHHKYLVPFWIIGSKNSLNPGGIPLTVSQEYPSSGSRKGRERSRLSSSWIARPSLWIRLSAEALAAATTASIKACGEDDVWIRQRIAAVYRPQDEARGMWQSAYVGDPRLIACVEVAT